VNLPGVGWFERLCLSSSRGFRFARGSTPAIRRARPLSRSLPDHTTGTPVCPAGRRYLTFRIALCGLYPLCDGPQTDPGPVWDYRIRCQRPARRSCHRTLGLTVQAITGELRLVCRSYRKSTPREPTGGHTGALFTPHRRQRRAVNRTTRPQSAVPNRVLPPVRPITGWLPAAVSRQGNGSPIHSGRGRDSRTVRRTDRPRSYPE